MIENGLSSAETLTEKADYTLPQRAWRTESGASTERSRDGRGILKKAHPRESMQSVRSTWSSTSVIPVVQEPKQMV